jgi:uncharacterized protein DUF4129
VAVTAPPEIRSPRARAVAIAIAGLGLLSLVALASQRPLLRAPTHAERALGSGWTSPLLTVAVVLGAAILLYGITLARREGRPTTGGDGWRLLGVLLIIVVASLLFRHYYDNRPGAPSGQTPPTSVAQRGATTASPPTTRRHQGTGATWWEVAGLAAAAVVALAAARVGPEKGVSKEGQAQPDGLVALLDDSLEDLRHDPDPRRAVIAAYARMERGLGATGLARSPADAPLEYLGRLMSARQVSQTAASRLTDLFEQAKFSDHRIDDDLRRDAIAALEAIRAELRINRDRVR